MGNSVLQQAIGRRRQVHPWTLCGRRLSADGTGDYGHGLDEVWNDLPGVKLVAVADDNKMGLAEKAKKLKVDKALPITARCSTT